MTSLRIYDNIVQPVAKGTHFPPLYTHQPFMTTLWLFLHHINSYYRLTFTSNGLFFHLSHLTSENITSLTSQAKLSYLSSHHMAGSLHLFISVPDSDKLCHETNHWEVIPNISVYWPTCRSQSSSNYYQTIESSLSFDIIPTILRIIWCILMFLLFMCLFLIFLDT